MRGKRIKGIVKKLGERITPAHAGKTPFVKQRKCKDSDHPRACGENETIGRNATEGRGSPPRMRGKQHSHIVQKVTSRITPAHAGKTRGLWSGLSAASDHPRACGENTSEMAYFRG